MSAVAVRQAAHVSTDLEPEVLKRIDRGAVNICEAELRYKLGWDERRHGPLLELLDELERQGLIESAIHFRLTERGRAQLAHDDDSPLRVGTGIQWEVRT